MRGLFPSRFNNKYLLLTYFKYFIIFTKQNNETTTKVQTFIYYFTNSINIWSKLKNSKLSYKLLVIKNNKNSRLKYFPIDLDIYVFCNIFQDYDTKHRENLGLYEKKKN